MLARWNDLEELRQFKIVTRLPLSSQSQADNIGRIRISVQAQQVIAGQTVSRTLQTEVTLRNRS